MHFEHPAVSLMARLLIVYIFATSGLGKILGWSGNVQYMSRHHLPMIPVLLGAALLIEVGGSLCLITGFQARAAAFVMFVYLLFVTLLLHNYWAHSGDVAGMQETHFRKNLAIMGGLLMITARGPGKWAIGERERS
ncbi:MAG TPA: DoxX family protein [Terriglobales bacterium]|nr:DoxX family protein [Terriglobales bacterium]